MLTSGSSGLDIDEVDVAAGNGKGIPALVPPTPMPSFCRDFFRRPDIDVQKGESRRGVGYRLVWARFSEAEVNVVVGREIFNYLI